MDKSQKQQIDDRDEVKSVYSRSLNSITINLPIESINATLTQNLENYIIAQIEGKCITEGYVKPGSIKIISNSSGLMNGAMVMFDVVYECLVCFPVSGMKLNCVVKNVTKAGIKAESLNETPSPFILFVARDHFYEEKKFLDIKENDQFIGRVIGQRFELNDPFISIIGEIVKIK